MFDIADIWATRTGTLVRLVSANDHVHRRGSAHYAGLALDLHSANPDGLADVLRRVGYRVLWKVPGHYGHLHVQERRLAIPPEAGRSAETPRPSGLVAVSAFRAASAVRAAAP